MLRKKEQNPWEFEPFCVHCGSNGAPYCLIKYPESQAYNMMPHNSLPVYMAAVTTTTLLHLSGTWMKIENETATTPTPKNLNLQPLFLALLTECYHPAGWYKGGLQLWHCSSLEHCWSMSSCSSVKDTSLQCEVWWVHRNVVNILLAISVSFCLSIPASCSFSFTTCGQCDSINGTTPGALII